jgi:ribonuclease HI
LDPCRITCMCLSTHLSTWMDIPGVVYSSDGTVLDFFSEQVSKSFLLAAMGSDQQTTIQELEMLALLVSIDLWCPTRSGRRVVAFTDSESVRGSFLKSWSFNEPCNKLLNRIFVLEEKYSCQVWLERVRSQSNPADALSRSQVAHFLGLPRTRVDTGKVWNHAAQS